MAAAPKKTTTKKTGKPRSVVKETPAPKKTPKKAAVKKPAAKKVTPKKTKPVTKPKKATTKAKAIPKKEVATSPKTKQPASTTTVQLPSRVSMRAQEKVLVLSEMFERDFFPVGLSVSRVAGLCFIAIGGFMSLSAVYGDAETVCAHGCVAQAVATESVPNAKLAQFTPGNVLLLGTLPTSLTETISLPLEIAGASDVSASLQFTDGAGDRLIALDVADRGNDKYVIEIRGSALDPNQYTLKVEAKFTGSDRYQTFTVGSFTIGSGNTAVAVDGALGDGSPTTEIVSDQSLRQAGRTESTTPAFGITAPAEISKTVTITANAPSDISNIEFFVRPVSGVNTQRIGQLPAGSSALQVNSLNLPNGTYELFARGVRNGTAVKTADVTVKIFNRESISAFDNSLEQERELLLISQELNKDLYESFEGGADVDESILLIAQEKLESDADTLEKLFTALSVAEQTGDEGLVRKTQEAIAAYRSNVVSQALADENDRYIANELDTALEQKFGQLQDKVQRFESVRRDRTENDSQTDTDGDGIADVDEQILYKTDPNNPDSDGDGFTDGAEIVKGFNPLSEEAEAVISYQSPKTTLAAFTTEKLHIETVEPDIVLETASTTERVQTTVRGKALANSFVTLYVFSTPTIVTVKTDETGAFEYTFSKELEDGEHQVFVALTDNTGEIVAQSQGFTFIKEARAFTPVDVSADSDQPAPAVYTEVQTTDNSVYTIVVGMAVLALGIVLLLLGFGLRHNQPEEAVIITEQ